MDPRNNQSFQNAEQMSYGFQQPPPYQGGGPPPGGFQQPPPYQGGAPPPGGYQQPPPYQGGAAPPGGFQPNAPPPPYQQSVFGGGQPAMGQPPGQCAVIRNVTSGLCVDGTEYEVKLQHFNGAPGQLWILEPLGGNRYVFKNRGNGAVLDIEGGPDCGANLITYEAHGGVNQQWYINPDGTITSAAGDLAVDIYEANCFPGQFLIAYDRHGGPNQQFNVKYQ